MAACNHFELVFYQEELDAGALYDVTFADDAFFDRLEKTKLMRLKWVEKSFRRFKLRDLEYVASLDPGEKYQVYRKQLLQSPHEAGLATSLPVLACAMRSDALNAFLFPSSTRLHEAVSVTRITFRLNATWSIIFERRCGDEETEKEKETGHIWLETSNQEVGVPRATMARSQWEPMIKSLMATWGATSGTAHGTRTASAAARAGQQP
jgi:hypothetical protein